MNDHGEDTAPANGGDGENGGDGDSGWAAEYVLGTLPLSDRMAFEARLRNEPALQSLVSDWEAHFAPLNAAYVPVPAPDLLPRIEARLFPVAAPVRRGFKFFGRAGLFGALAVVAVAAFVILRPFGTETVPELVATLSATGQPLVFAASYDEQTDALTVRRTSGDPAAAGQDYELWVIGASGVPQSLGVMPAQEITVTLPDLQPQNVLAVSLEAAGGSTTGAPTTVLVTGPVTSL